MSLEVKLRPVRLWVWLGLILALSGLAGPIQAREKADFPELSPQLPRHGLIDLTTPNHSISYRISVDAQTYALRLKILNAQADLDLAVSDLDGNELWSAKTSDWNDKLLFYRLGAPALEDGDYLVTVAFGGDYRPTQKGQVLNSLGFDLEIQEIRVDQYETLPLGQLTSQSLDPDGGMLRAYRFDVPVQSTQLRVDIFGSQADTDIYGQARVAFSDPRLAKYAAQTWRSRESLIIPIPKPSPFKSGVENPKGTVPVYVMVLAELDSTPADFQMLASLGSAVPDQLKALPQLKIQSNAGLDRALDATVEIITETSGGSGSVISPDGWILTNCHVLRGNDGQLSHRVSVGFSDDRHRVPDSQFWAELSAYDEARDLALLRIVSGFYGQEIPSGFRFPSLLVGKPENLRLGDQLYFVGYPTIGGLGNRATITCTGGIVSGFQDRSGVHYLKSAGVVSSGNSGGAALDAQGLLLGIPTLVVGNETGQLAYICSLENVPEAWWRTAGLAVPMPGATTNP